MSINIRLLVVADGVGGWNQKGIDPALYSKELCNNISKLYDDYMLKNYFNNEDESLFDENRLKTEILINSVNLSKNEGSSTCSILMLDKFNEYLYSAYIGDSCYMILRKGDTGNYDLLFKSEEQSHGFNIPYQVGKSGDNPTHAKTNRHQIQNNDLIILATDGIWDNLSVSQIMDIINKHISESGDISKLANKLAKEAETLSWDKSYNSPFAQKAREKNIVYYGGKPDDITIIIGQVYEDVNGERNLRYSDSYKNANIDWKI
jgi:protein phosphatase PTC7